MRAIVVYDPTCPSADWLAATVASSLRARGHYVDVAADNAVTQKMLLRADVVVRLDAPARPEHEGLERYAPALPAHA